MIFFFSISFSYNLATSVSYRKKSKRMTDEIVEFSSSSLSSSYPSHNKFSVDEENNDDWFERMNSFSDPSSEDEEPEEKGIEKKQTKKAVVNIHQPISFTYQTIMKIFLNDLSLEHDITIGELQDKWIDHLHVFMNNHGFHVRDKKGEERQEEAVKFCEARIVKSKKGNHLCNRK